MKAERSNPIGAGTRNLSVNVPESLYNKLQDLAKQSELRIGEYVRLILFDASKKQLIAKRTTTVELTSRHANLVVATHSAGALVADVARRVAGEAHGKSPATHGRNAPIFQPPKGVHKGQGSQK